MIQVTKTPLRVSLAGGSTDLQEYLHRYGTGSVVSFTPNLFTYIILKESTDGCYRIVYSKIESVVDIKDIKNDIAREVLLHFSMPPVEVIFTADIPSSGSGLASSTSYLINLIKACLEFQNKSMSVWEIGELAIKLERKFNPLTGYQDVYGCLITGFKTMFFNEKGLYDVTRLPSDLEIVYDLHLIPTNSTRSSTGVLETLDYQKVHEMSTLTADMQVAIVHSDYEKVASIINTGWVQKKQTSPHIVSETIAQMETEFTKTTNITAWRLIGAGFGGYFLALVKKNTEIPFKSIKINIYDV